MDPDGWVCREGTWGGDSPDGWVPPAAGQRRGARTSGFPGCGAELGQPDAWVPRLWGRRKGAWTPGSPRAAMGLWLLWLWVPLGFAEEGE